MIHDYRASEYFYLHLGHHTNPNDVVLDALCGDFFATKDLVGRVREIVGIDRQPPKELVHGVTFSQQNLETLTWQHDYFTKAFLNTGFHHVGNGNQQKQQDGMNNLFQVLSSRGIVRIADLEGNTTASTLQDSYVPGHKDTCRWMTPQILYDLLAHADFDHIEVERIAVPWTFEDAAEMEQVVRDVFRTSLSTIKEHGLLLPGHPSLVLPFVYATGVKP